MKTSLALALATFLLPLAARAQYNDVAGKSAPMQSLAVDEKQKDGTIVRRMVERKVASDSFGNARGNQNDLARDGAFEGQTIAVIQLYDFPFDQPRAALKEKGFSVYRWVNQAPSASELKQALEKSCELWLISGDTQKLGPDHLAVIKAFFDAGHGVYIWGDNAPYYADANYVARALVGTTMSGDVPGDQVMPLQQKLGHVGLMPNHLLSTGLEHLYEGVTIATIAPNQNDEGAPLRVGRQPGDGVLRRQRSSRDPRRRLHAPLQQVGHGRHGPLRQECSGVAHERRALRKAGLEAGRALTGLANATASPVLWARSWRAPRHRARAG